MQVLSVLREFYEESPNGEVIAGLGPTFDLLVKRAWPYAVVKYNSIHGITIEVLRRLMSMFGSPGQQRWI